MGYWSDILQKEKRQNLHLFLQSFTKELTGTLLKDGGKFMIFHPIL